MSKFGWCMDGNDERCRVHYIDWNNEVRECSCSCHEGKPKPPLPERKPVPEKPIKGRKKK